MSRCRSNSFPRRATLSAVPALVAVAALLAADSATVQAAGERCTDRAEALTGPPYGEGEPTIVVPQRDQDRLIASWTATGVGEKSEISSPISGSVVLAQRRADGSWSQEVVSPGSPWGDTFSGDSWLDTAPDGSAYVSYDREYFGVEGFEVQTLVRRVVPGKSAGKEQATPFYDLDHPALAVDQSDDTPSRLYLVGTSGQHSLPGVLAISDDDGHSWREPVRFPDPSAWQLAPVVASGGDTVVVAWVEGLSSTAVKVAPVDRVTGQFGPAKTVAVSGGYGIGSLPFGASAIPSLSVVRGGPYEGRAYLVWPKRRGDSSRISDIYVSVSDDGGKTWFEPERVNDDGDAESYHVFPSIAARPDGSALVAWMDTRDDPTNATALMYGAVVDGDGSVAENIRPTDCPTFDEGSGSRLGDYFKFDASQQDPVMVFPNIRREGEDSDVFLLEGPWAGG